MMSGILTLTAPCIHSANRVDKVRNFPLSDVTLLDSEFKRADELNVDVLLKYDVDRLLAPFLKEAGLEPKGEYFPNWAGLDGHVGGHYLSALAFAYASTGNEECKRIADYMVSELKRCAEANGDGYIGGVPESKVVWDALRAGDDSELRKRWVPWYNVHKIYAGLLDAYRNTGNEDARKLFLGLCDWGIDVTSALDSAAWEKMLDIEFGGMNEVYADAYDLTGDSKYMDMAKKFSHRWLFDSMRRGIDNLDNRHANTQVPKAVGYQRVAESSGDSDYRDAAEFFWTTVTGNRSLSFGGNSRREHFPSAEGCVEYTMEREGPESCNTYNMLKLSEGLFRLNPHARYADFYERALFNHIRSTQHPEHGGYVYFTSARPRHYRIYSSPNDAMWCCVGTGMENHGKYGEFIYSHSDDDLYVNLFIPSSVEWKEKGITLTQTTDFPAQESTCLALKMKKDNKFTLKIRLPHWIVTDKPDIYINGKIFKDYQVTPDSYITIDKKWKNGDIVDISLPMTNYVEAMPNVPDFLSIMHGPITLASRAGTEDLAGLVADDSRWGHIAHGKLLPLYEAPIINGTKEDIEALIKDMKPLEGKPLHYKIPGLFIQKEYSDIELEPFSGIHDSRYCVYWQAMDKSSYEDNMKNLALAEQERLRLDSLTVDKITLGEQQPEADHKMKESNTSKGYHENESFRTINPDGYLSFILTSDNQKALNIDLRMLGDIIPSLFIEESEIDVEPTVSTADSKGFRHIRFTLPERAADAEKDINFTLRNKKKNPTGGINSVRLICR